MPGGIPVATVAIDGAQNAALLAAEMLALSDDALVQKLDEMRVSQHDSVIKKDKAIDVAAILAE
ncbi:N5-carboxyaminoimidazole ribonucleotide mutase [bioreactor metagenome]|uniref:N5-carboxyaminoimidazole ribonucleotide mutase n=1 Tax=bioreactor metagenome TaxID=1076179 RepID=A0A645JNL9_9ZZZZ